MSKLIIIGAGGVGKTAYVKKAIKEKYEVQSESEHGVTVHPFPHTHNGVRYMYEAHVSTGNHGNCYTDARFAIVMFDVTSKRTFEGVRTYIHEIREVCGNIPIAVHANKHDMFDKHSNISLEEMNTLMEEEDVKVWQTSSKANWNMYKSLDWFVNWYV